MQMLRAGEVRESESVTAVKSGEPRLEGAWIVFHCSIRDLAELHVAIGVFVVSISATSATGDFGMGESSATKEGAAGISSVKI